ncbi:hypothetical protein PZA11_005864 [Diplocarpon coronariae]
MLSNNFLAVFALTTAGAAVLVHSQLWGASLRTKSSDASKSTESLFGSPFGNGNSNDNGNSNFNGTEVTTVRKRNGNGNRNEFGTDNSVLDGNSGLSIGRRKILSGFQAFGTYAGQIIDDITQPLLPGTADSLWVSPNSSRKPNGNINAAGSATLPTATGSERISPSSLPLKQKHRQHQQCLI